MARADIGFSELLSGLIQTSPFSLSLPHCLTPKQKIITKNAVLFLNTHQKEEMQEKVKLQLFVP